MLTWVISWLGMQIGGVAASPKTKGSSLNSVEIGPWTFSLPTDWNIKSGQMQASPYFESLDGAKGCYIKSLDFSPTLGNSELEIASHIQKLHKDSFQQNPKAKWKVSGETKGMKNNLTYTSLELFDKDAYYLIRSDVLVKGALAVQLTLHDYNCEDYAASAKYISRIADSLRAR